MMRLVLALLSFYLFMLANAVLWNVPLLGAAWLIRRRVPESAARLTVAFGFSAATAWLLWKIEWFDVWRHGVPPVSYLLGSYLPFVLAVGAAGWFASGLVVRRRRPSPRGRDALGSARSRFTV